MKVLWVTLLLLHQGYTLVSVTTARLGEPATISCAFPDDVLRSERLQWYKQSAGDNLKLIVTLKKNTNPVYEPEFPASRFDVKVHENISSLTILRTTEEDEGMYHCALMEWIKITWSGTYLSLKGNTQRTSNFTVVQWPTVSGLVRPGDSMTLQCSVLSDSETKTCPGDHSVFWFRAGSDKSHPNILYTDGNGHDECDKRSDTQKSCVYRFTKSVSSSDAGTYYCAVATCGEIFFGDGTNLYIQGTSTSSGTAINFLLCAVLAISLIIIAFLIYGIKWVCRNAAVAVQKNSRGQKSRQRDEDMLVYSTAIFTMMKTDGGAERERIYAAVKAFGLD